MGYSIDAMLEENTVRQSPMPIRPKTRSRRAPGGSKSKVTLSIDSGLVSYADEKAARVNGNRSQVVEELLAQDKAREEDELAAEGYKFFNSEAAEFASASLSAVSEALGSGE